MVKEMHEIVRQQRVTLGVGASVGLEARRDRATLRGSSQPQLSPRMHPGRPRVGRASVELGHDDPR